MIMAQISAVNIVAELVKEGRKRELGKFAGGFMGKLKNNSNKNHHNNCIEEKYDTYKNKIINRNNR